MSMQKLKRFFNKEDFDYSKGIVDPCEFHKTFYHWLRWFQVLDNESIPRWTYHTQRFIAINTLIAITLAFFGLYGNFKKLDLPRTTEAGTYAIILIYQMLNQSCTRLNVPQYHSLLRTMREDFKYVCTTGQRYRKRFFDTQLLTWKISVTVVMFLSFIVFFMDSSSFIMLIMYLLKSTHEEGDERPLLFPFWVFNIKFTDSPIYEIVFIYTNYTIAIYGFAYIFMIQNGIVWVREIGVKADLIMYSLEDLVEDMKEAPSPKERLQYDSIIKVRMRHIIMQHHSMYNLLQDYAKVYKKLLMYEQKIAVPVICLTAYGFAERYSEGELHAILILILISGSMVIFVSCYLCTFLLYKVTAVGNACMNVKFWLTGPVVRPYLVLIMQRSMRPLPLTAPGFADVSLETFSRIISSAYQMFNVLRQTNINI